MILLLLLIWLAGFLIAYRVFGKAAVKAGQSGELSPTTTTKDLAHARTVLSVLWPVLVPLSLIGFALGVIGALTRRR